MNCYELYFEKEYPVPAEDEAVLVKLAGGLRGCGSRHSSRKMDLGRGGGKRNKGEPAG